MKTAILGSPHVTPLGRLRTVLQMQRSTLLSTIGVAVTVIVISALHYLTSLQSIGWHELFKRLYYVPIVVAAVTRGARAGIATSLFSTLLYVPHVILQWHAWPALDSEQYGEVLMFNIVALVTGAMADRLHAQRQRYQDAVSELQTAYATLEAKTEERQRVDRLVTVGRIASGIAHEIRTPLASLLGSLEIIGSEFPSAHPKSEFVEIAKQEIARLQAVVTEFLDFAQPATPTTQAIDLRLVVQMVARLARPAVACRNLVIDARVPEGPLVVHIDVQQVQRALLNIVLASAHVLRDGRITLTVQGPHDVGRIIIELDGPTTLPAAGDIFEPFRASGPGQGLGLAIAARLIENQRGTVDARVAEGHLLYVVDLPAVTAEQPVLAGAHDLRA